MRGLLGTVAVLAMSGPSVALAAEPLGNRPLSVLLLLSALTLLPFVFVMITSFAKIVVVLSIVRSALGTPQIPPNVVITGLAVVLTIYVMAPTGQQVYRAAVAEKKGSAVGLLSAEGAAQLHRAALRAKEPIRAFLVAQSPASERARFRRLRRRMLPADQRASVGERDLLVVVPAFVVSQLEAAFKIGFLLYLPFVIIELVVANILLALGMHMLSPTTVSLPFKLLLFVLVDGWSLICQGLVLSYN